MTDVHPATPMGSPLPMSDLLCDNPDVMASLLRALSDPGKVTPRAPMESLVSWQRRAVIEHAAPHIRAAERKRILDRAIRERDHYREALQRISFGAGITSQAQASVIAAKALEPQP